MIFAERFARIRATPVRRIGLVGGIASGKSTAARLLSELGAEVFDADRSAHQALEDPAIRAAIRERWGGGVFREDGSVDRASLGAAVFSSDSRDRQALEAIVHARVFEDLERAVTLLEAASRPGSARLPVLVIDAPLLVETGLHEACEALVFIDTPRETRERRAQAERGWPPDELARRESHQAPLARKRALASVVLSGESSVEALRAELARFLQGA